jgi:hypothetical protein
MDNLPVVSKKLGTFGNSLGTFGDSLESFVNSLGTFGNSLESFVKVSSLLAIVSVLSAIVSSLSAKVLRFFRGLNVFIISELNFFKKGRVFCAKLASFVKKHGSLQILS